jgi:hypothetical protein
VVSFQSSIQSSMLIRPADAIRPFGRCNRQLPVIGTSGG